MHAGHGILIGLLLLPFWIAGKVFVARYGLGFVDCLGLLLLLSVAPIVAHDKLSSKEATAVWDKNPTYPVSAFIGMFVVAWLLMKANGPSYLPSHRELIDVNSQFAQYCAAFMFAIPAVCAACLAIDHLGGVYKGRGQPAEPAAPPPLLEITPQEQTGEFSFDPNRFKRD